METKLVIYPGRRVEDGYHPHNEQAKLLAALVGEKALTWRTLDLALALGFEIVIASPLEVMGIEALRSEAQWRRRVLEAQNR